MHITYERKLHQVIKQDVIFMGYIMKFRNNTKFIFPCTSEKSHAMYEFIESTVRETYKSKYITKCHKFEAELLIIFGRETE